MHSNYVIFLPSTVPYVWLTCACCADTHPLSFISGSAPFTSQPPCVFFPGHRASEGWDREVGEGAVLGGHAGGIWRPVLSVLVQPLCRAELQEEHCRACHCSAGGDHWGGRHRDTTQLAPPAVRGTFRLTVEILFRNIIKISVSKDFCDARNYLDLEFLMLVAKQEVSLISSQQTWAFYSHFPCMLSCCHGNIPKMEKMT